MGKSLQIGARSLLASTVLVKSVTLRPPSPAIVVGQLLTRVPLPAIQIVAFPLLALIGVLLTAVRKCFKE